MSTAVEIDPLLLETDEIKTEDSELPLQEKEIGNSILKQQATEPIIIQEHSKLHTTSKPLSFPPPQPQLRFRVLSLPKTQPRLLPLSTTQSQILPVPTTQPQLIPQPKTQHQILRQPKTQPQILRLPKTQPQILPIPQTQSILLPLPIQKDGKQNQEKKLKIIRPKLFNCTLQQVEVIKKQLGITNVQAILKGENILKLPTHHTVPKKRPNELQIQGNHVTHLSRVYGATPKKVTKIYKLPEEAATVIHASTPVRRVYSAPVTISLPVNSKPKQELENFKSHSLWNVLPKQKGNVNSHAQTEQQSNTGISLQQVRENNSSKILPANGNDEKTKISLDHIIQTAQKTEEPMRERKSSFECQCKRRQIDALQKRVKANKQVINNLKKQAKIVQKINSPLLMNIIVTYAKNATKKPHGKRWPDSIKKLAIDIYRRSPCLYRTLSGILGLPSVTSMQKTIKMEKENSSAGNTAPIPGGFQGKHFEIREKQNRLCELLLRRIDRITEETENHTKNSTKSK